MTWTIEEKYDARRVSFVGVGDDARVEGMEVTYIAFSSEPADMRQAVEAVADFAPQLIDQDFSVPNEPPFSSGNPPPGGPLLSRRSIRGQAEPATGLSFEIQVAYRQRDSQEQIDTERAGLTFRTTGASQLITQSIATKSIWDSTGENTDLPKTGAINFDDVSVNGTDIVVPQYTMTIRKTFAQNDIPINYRTYLFWLTGKVNQDEFLGYKPGEVLFLGGEGDRRRDEPLWDFTFEFACSPNITNGGGPEPWDKGIEVGDITVDEKEGWDYLWVRYAPDTDDDGELLQKPIAAYVEQVYERADFSKLGLEDIEEE